MEIHRLVATKGVVAKAVASLGVAFALIAISPPACADASNLRPSVQVGFSPEGSAARLVLDVIDRSEREIRVMAYSFTSPEIARALMAAKRRGVDVQVVVDAGESRSRAATAALNLLSSAGVGVRLNNQYKIQHDKVIIADGRHIETGSFNYSRAAATSNSENAIVLWNRPDVAAAYLDHWRSRWSSGTPFRSTY
ncbi:phospholipase D family protein [Burkholderia cenocepacia]|uniref:phospholipase D family nuclease n=1 Tax=Burkholderia cenocepacia TaxID=95486 RepID=UPI001B96CDE4|nr:phospholipase D family protein [Burkholderia cenocepacia]MBR7989473.1 phospholipase D family protein [Burkholderia cenocepacia]